MAHEEEGTFMCIASGLWKGIGPSFSSNPESDDNHSKDLTSLDNPTRKIKWKRPANSEQLITPTSVTVASKNASNVNKNRKGSKLKDHGWASTISEPSFQLIGGKRANQPVQNGSSASNMETPKKILSETDASNGNDLYSLPLSPILSHQQKGLSKLRKALALSPRFDSVKASSLAMHARGTGLGAQKKRGNQKRVPKRSILDPPETSKLELKTTGPSAPQHDAEPLQPAQLPGDLSVASTQIPSMQRALTTGTKKQLYPRREHPPTAISSDSEKRSEMDENSKEESDFMPHMSSLLIGREPFDQDSSMINMKQQGARLVKVQTENEDELKNIPRSNQSSAYRERAVPLLGSCKQESPRKRKVSPVSKTMDAGKEKILKVGSIRMPDENEMASMPIEIQSSPKSLRALPVNDPFSVHGGSDPMAPTEFTAKLLNTTCQTEYADSMHCRERSDPVSFERMKSSRSGKHIYREANNIARQVMCAFQAAESRRTSSMNRERENETRDVWLNGTDSYSETIHVMSYVCKTILRFLKSKESAINDVATEYFQRGSVVIKCIKTLHSEERDKVFQTFETCRLDSIRLFETAHQDIRVLAGKLGGIHLAPVVSEVLADNVTTGLYALQDEIV